MAQTAQLFARAGHLYLNVIGGHDGANLPHTALVRGFGEVTQQAWIKLQLSLDCLQHRISLVYAVHHNHDVMLAPGDDAPQTEQLRHDGGLTFTARGGNGIVFALV